MAYRIASGMVAEAFGNHALKLLDFPQDRIDAFLVASRYAIYNGLGLCIVSLHPRFSKHRFAGPAIAVGGFIFSVTIMIVVLSRGLLSGLSKVVPFGPTIAIAG
ncbi:hypothetical protein BC827DRAFT_303827 [Russula dissimulans]|nr:hypothetical protein BC827DRAFT_303827 [Russula dissimulans]